MSGGWGESRYVIVSMAELIRIPKFIELMDTSVVEDEQEIEVDSERAELLEKHGQEVIHSEDERFFWVRKGIPLSIVKKFMVDELDANPAKDVEVDFVGHRTVDGQEVTCDRFWSFHKDSKFVDQELFNDLNKMQDTSTWGK